MWFLIKMIFRLATLAVFAFAIYAIYAFLTGRNVDLNNLVSAPSGPFVYEEIV